LTSGPLGPLVRVRMTVAYDGTGFSGIAPQPGVRTVGGVLVEAIERVLRHSVQLTVAGRTDAGVHAWGQVVSFDAAEGADLEVLQRSLNKLCGPAIVVREIAIGDDAFDARHSAKRRRYRYSVLNTPLPDPFLRGTTWHVPQPLEVSLLRLGCDPLIGEHDFAAFCRKQRGQDGSDKSTVRKVVDARWLRLDDGVLRFDIEATAFCQQMVRAIVGTLVDVGLGRRTPADVAATIRSRDRAQAGTLAPPQGLSLWEVVY
jgi:tRNA pseudouridine38-40 synthase